MKIPKKINNKSPTMNIEVTKKILFFFIPCSITNKFCAPIASIKLKPVEKPKIKDAQSNYAIIGRYILPKKIMNEIKRLKPGQGKEIHITDAIKNLILKCVL